MKYKVAVATSDGKSVDSHFGHVSVFSVYEVDEETGEFEELDPIETGAACQGAECGGKGGGQMERNAEALSEVQYVLAAKIGPHAIQALARKGVSAFDVALPVGEAISKINGYRAKLAAKKLSKNQSET